MNVELLPVYQWPNYPHKTGAAIGLDHETWESVRPIVEAVRQEGWEAGCRYAQRWGDIAPGQPSLFSRDDLQQAARDLPSDVRALLTRVRDRIAAFAAAQKGTCLPMRVAVNSGWAGHEYRPIERVGCYVPAGRFPLPSTALMTVVTAREAGCSEVVMASPHPSPLMLGVAGLAGADQLLAWGGAQAIAALAYGAGTLKKVDLICGPGNRFVTAAKKMVFGDVGIDMLAGPSELVIVGDSNCNAAWIAADLLAQAEHDEDARTYLVTCDADLIQRVHRALAEQLPRLTTRATAAVSLSRGAAILCSTLEEVIAACRQLAPEHLEVPAEASRELAERLPHAGCLFWGSHSAEVFGDYGVGPNHTLPTAGTARFTAGLNVMTFLRPRTWLELQAPLDPQLIADTVQLAELEGLAGHAAAARFRASNDSTTSGT